MAKGFHKVGFDGWSPIDAAAAKLAGAIALQGYLVGDSAMTRAWVQSVTDSGLLVWSGWELSATAPELGAGQGVIDANAGCAAADALDQPKGSGIYISNDSSITDENAVLAYFWAAAPIVKAHGFVPGLYGQTSLWETIKSSYPLFWHASDGTPAPWPGQIVQSGSEVLSSGETVDVDEITNPNFGGWSYAAPVPTPTNLNQEDEMTLIRIDNANYYLLFDGGIVKIIDNEGDLARLQAAKIPEITLSQALVTSMVNAAKNRVL
jgi:hypothetical protein